jgi:hypothetical protein
VEARSWTTGIRGRLRLGLEEHQGHRQPEHAPALEGRILPWGKKLHFGHRTDGIHAHAHRVPRTGTCEEAR